MRVPYELLEERLLQRGGTGKDYFESKGAGFFKRVVEGYDWISDNLPVQTIDGSGTPEEVWSSLQLKINLLEANHGI